MCRPVPQVVTKPPAPVLNVDFSESDDGFSLDTDSIPKGKLGQDSTKNMYAQSTHRVIFLEPRQSLPVQRICTQSKHHSILRGKLGQGNLIHFII